MTARTFTQTFSQTVAGFLLVKLIGLRIPLSVEYLRDAVHITVPTTFADTVTKQAAEVGRALASGSKPGSYN